MITINIHPSLVRYTNNQRQLKLATDNINNLFIKLGKEYPLLGKCIFNQSGELSPYVNVYINEKDFKHCAPNIELYPEDKVDILTSLVGG